MWYFGLFLDSFLFIEYGVLFNLLAEGLKILVNFKCFYFTIRVGRWFSKVCYLITPFLSCVGFKKDSYYLALITDKVYLFFPLFEQEWY